jgi:hypothetical protein
MTSLEYGDVVTPPQAYVSFASKVVVGGTYWHFSKQLSVPASAFPASFVPASTLVEQIGGRGKHLPVMLTAPPVQVLPASGLAESGLAESVVPESATPPSLCPIEYSQ